MLSRSLRLFTSSLFVLTVASCADDPPAVTDTGPEALTFQVVMSSHSPWRYWDRGGDLGTAWVAPAYDDAAWAAGGAPMGYGESYLVTHVGYGGDPANKHVTTYFRTEFEIEDVDDIARLNGRVMYDDGAVIYLNGTRVDALSMPAGPITASTFAFGHEANATVEDRDWTAWIGLLHDGTNTIAAEVHQADRSSSDLVFAVQLEIEVVDHFAIERRSAWRYWDQDAPPPAAWRAPSLDDSAWEEGPAPLGYGESYIATTVDAGGTGPSNRRITTYFRRRFQVADPAAVTALRAEVKFDDGAVIYLNGTEIARESMPTGTITATTRAIGHEADPIAYEGRDWTASRNLLVAGDNWIAVEVHQQDPASSDLVWDLALDVQSGGPPPPPPPGEDIPRRSIWAFWDGGGDLGTGWRARTYDDGWWTDAPGVLGYGEPYVNSTISYGPFADNKRITSYFRRRFTVADPSAVTALTAELMYDDGAVIYLNGTEIARPSMPSGTITAATLALGHEAANTYLTFDWTAARGLLVAGENVIAVEVHQDSPTSSDLVFDLALEVTTAAPPAGIERRTRWRYRAGPEPFDPFPWRNPSYDDAAWPTGEAPLGYGEPYVTTTIPYGPSSSNKWITTYFRREFTLDDPDRVTEMIAYLMYDDGIAVFLNGQPLVRRGLTDTYPDWGDFGANREAARTYQVVDVTTLKGLLRPGRNVVAAEVHQDDAGSSDLVFDVGLELTLAPMPASIPRRSAWFSRDDGADLGTSWRTSTSNAGWSAEYGPIEGHEPHVTMYARRTFRVDSPAAVTQIRGELFYEDGAVVYVNGHEIARPNMPAGPITASTLALSDRDADAANGRIYEAFDWTAARAFLVPGENVIAVEVHLSAPDAVWRKLDLALQINTSATPRIASDCEPVTVPRRGGNLAGVWVAPSGAVWAVGTDGIIGRGSASGGGWVWCTPSHNTVWTEVWGSGAGDVWMVGSGGVVKRWNGSSFDDPDLGTTVDLAGVWGTGPSNVYVTGRSSVVRRFDGTTWHVVDLPAGRIARAVWGANPTDVWVAANSCTPNPGEPNHPFCRNEVFRWNPATGAFAVEAFFTNDSTALYGIGGSGPTDVWAVGESTVSGAADGYAFAAHYDGTQWVTLHPPEALRGDGRAYTDVAARAPGAETGAWITVEGNGSMGLLRWDGATWTEDQSGTSHLSSIDWRGTSLFAVGADWKVMRWTGFGWMRDH